MSEFTSFEPMFKETYTFLLNSLRRNMIYVMDDDSWRGRLCWVKLLANILAAISHTGGVVDRIGLGADLVQISTDLSAALILWQAVLIYAQICVNRKLLKRFIIRLGSVWRTDEQLRSEMITVKHTFMTSFHRWITIFSNAITVYVYLYLWPRLLLVAFKHFILKEKVAFTMPFYLKTPFATEDNFLVYTLVYLADLKILVDVGNLVCHDLLLMNTAMHHLRLLFVILQDDLRHIVDFENDTEETKLMKLKRNIPHHQILMQLMLELSTAFGAIFIIHLAFFSGTLCFFGFAARIQPSPESIKNLLASNIILLCIYSCCYYGQNLINASVDIAQAAYDGQWQLMSQEYKRCTLFIMLRSQSPQYIKSTSFINVSLETFTKILNVTWSFLSLMTNVYETKTEENM